MAREWNDLQEREVDVDSDALLAAINAAPGRITVPGTEGAVATYNGQDYDTWHDLAFAFGLNAADFAMA